MSANSFGAPSEVGKLTTRRGSLLLTLPMTDLLYPWNLFPSLPPPFFSPREFIPAFESSPTKDMDVWQSNSGNKFSKHLPWVLCSLLSYNKCCPLLPDTHCLTNTMHFGHYLTSPYFFQKESENSLNNLSDV